MNRNVVIAVRLLAVGVLLLIAQPEDARAEEPPYALLNEWWQWALSIPSAVNPILDNSGKNCSIGQRGNLWLLAGNTGGRTVRDCTLPAAKNAYHSPVSSSGQATSPPRGRTWHSRACSRVANVR